jgi:hypothetical protein
MILVSTPPYGDQRKVFHVVTVNSLCTSAIIASVLDESAPPGTEGVRIERPLGYVEAHKSALGLPVNVDIAWMP